MVILKFGGSSLADIEEIRRVTSIIESQLGRNPVVVVSALGDITNVLEHLADLSLEHSEKFVINELNDFFEPRLYRIISGVVSKNAEQQQCLSDVNRIMQELKNVYRGLTVVKELTPRAMDTLLSYGEKISQTVITHALRSMNIAGVEIPAQKCVITDANFGRADVLWDQTSRSVEEHVVPAIEQNQVPVLQGFVGGTSDGTVTTLGRGGSDYTAAVLGSILGAEDIQIWTDVDGFLNADPGLVDEATTIEKLNIEEAKELANFGARVLHPRTVLPAIERDIPVYIRNTFAPEKQGTVLSGDKTGAGIHCLTAVRDLVRIELSGTAQSREQFADLINSAGWSQIYLTMQSPNAMTAIVDPGEPRLIDRFCEELSDEIECRTETEIGIIGIVGESLTTNSEEYRNLIGILEKFEYDFFPYSPNSNRWLLAVKDFNLSEIFSTLFHEIFNANSGKTSE